MCTSEDRILVAVSGGKDSLALWDVLTRFGYSTSGIHIQLGIGDYLSQGQVHASSFAEKNNRTLITVDLERDYDMGVPKLSRTLRRIPCSGCGMSRRYIFNREAYKREFAVVVTEHNLDDEAATLLGNVLHWQMGYLAHQALVLDSTHLKFVKKIEPLYTLTERETAAFCLLQRVPYHAEEYPNSVGARSLLYAI